MIRCREALALGIVLASFPLAGGPPGDHADTNESRILEPDSQLAAVRDLLARGQNEPAVVAVRRALEDRRIAADSLLTSRFLDLLAEALPARDSVANAEARVHQERSIRILESLQPGSEDVAQSLIRLAVLHREAGHRDSAAACYIRALAIRGSLHGQESPSLVAPLNGLARVVFSQGHPDSAERLLRRALAIQESHLGPDDLGAAEILNSLANVLHESGRYVEVMELRKRTNSIWEGRLGPDDPQFARGLANLGNLMFTLGELDSATRNYVRAIDILESSLGRDHPDVAQVCTNLGAVRSKMGDFAGARMSLERARDIQERALGPEHAALSATLSDLGVALLRLGDRVGALSCQQRALTIAERRIGPRTHRTAIIAGRLGVAHRAAGNQQAALESYGRQVAILEDVFGRDHPDLGPPLWNLARARLARRDFGAAESLFIRSRAVQERALGPDHAEIAWALEGLGELEMARGNWEAARVHQGAALDLRTRHLGREHPLVAQSWISMATALAAEGRTHEAIQASLQAELISRAHLWTMARAIAEAEALGYSGSRPHGLPLALSLVTSMEASDSLVLGAVWDAVARSRCVVLDVSMRRNRLVAAADSAAPQRQAWLQARSRLSDLLLLPYRGRPPKDYAAQVDSAARDMRDQERRLARRVSDTRHPSAVEEPGFDRVRTSLGPEEALIAFVRYEHVVGKAPGTPRTPHYIALATKGPTGAILAFPLGPADDLDRAVAAWRAEVERALRQPPWRLKAAEESCRRRGAALARIALDPILRQLGRVNRLNLVPDGALHFVNFAAMPHRAGYLADTPVVLTTLTSEKDLVDDTGPTVEHGLLAVGGPDFGTQAAPSGSRLERERAGAGVLDPCSASIRSVFDFSPLPHAPREAQEVAALWKSGARRGTEAHGEDGREEVICLTRADATEAAFRSLAPRFTSIHIATHGFHVSADCELPRGLWPWQGTLGATGVDASAFELLSHSGLALAGAGGGQQGPASTDSDGILSAMEVATLDLTGVRRAVLSGCDTGLGEIWNWEGTFGLRRAFRSAGARNLVCSLWAVEDAQSRRWMQNFYRAMAGGMDEPTAVHEAMRTELRHLRSSGSPTHPALWAAFVPVGRGSLEASPGREHGVAGESIAPQ